MFNSKFGVGILKHPGYNDPFSAAISIGSSLIGGAMQSDAAQSAADTQSATAAQQMALQKQIFDTQNAQQAPYRASGYNSLNLIGSMLPGQQYQYDNEGNVIKDAKGNPVMQTGSGYLTHQFDNQDLNSSLAPNYAFQLQQGQQAAQNASNATGGLVGGNAMKAMQDYSQNFAGNAYQQAFNNYQTQRGNIYNNLASIAGIGQTGQAASNQLASNYGLNTANLATGSAAAQAAGQIGSANALSGAFGNAANMYSLSRMLGQGGGVGGTFGSGTSNASGGISLAGMNPFG